jgi:pyruvate dehydrogenase E2 component (dihydrolipoamide acetyltransferase)
VLARRLDERMLALQRQGRIGTFAPVSGQEAAQIGAVAALEEHDWFVPSFRESAAAIWRGTPLKQILLYNAGYNEGAAVPDDAHDLPIAIPVATQIPHAVGLAYAVRYRDTGAVAIAFFSDGATSEGDFHEALNFAGVFGAPTIFLCQNNQWAISVPRERQTRSRTLAQKALTYGVPGIQVDGNDVLAVLAATREAAARARDGEGPTLIECVGDQVRVGDVLLTFDGDSNDDGDDDDGDGREASPDEAERKGAPGAQSADAEPESRGATAASSEDPDVQKGRTSAEAPPRQNAERNPQGPVPAAPSTRRLARELGVVLERIDASGPGGRVLAEDVRSAAQRGGTESQAEHPSGKEERRETEQAELKATKEGPARRSAPDYEPPDFSRWGPVEEVPLRSVRRATAREMARAWAEIPHVMHHDFADVTALERFRRAHADAVAEDGGKLTLTVLVLKALAAALRAMPRFNASLDAEGETIILKHYCHIGVAVATDQGLLVPVVRDVDRKSLRELAVELTEQAHRARAGELERDAMQGGSFTLTNVGGIGGRLFTPIIRHPEAAILGLARARLTPTATGELDAPQISARLHLPLCLAFDHRLNDGAEAARFMNHILDSLQDPESLLLSA